MNLIDRLEREIPNYFDCEITRIDEHFVIGKCIDFYLVYNGVYYIYLEYLNKCKYSGTESLKRLEMLCNNFSEIKYIELEDASMIGFEDSKGNKFEYSLSLMYIMATGMSWYNSHGYKQKTFKEDCIVNEFIIDKNFYYTFKYLYDNIYRLNKEDLDYLYYNLNNIYFIIYNQQEKDKYKVIEKCFEYIFDNYLLLFIDEDTSIKDVGQIIKNSKGANTDEIIYLKDIILIIIFLAFKFDDNIYLIKKLQ